MKIKPMDLHNVYLKCHVCRYVGYFHNTELRTAERGGRKKRERGGEREREDHECGNMAIE